MTEKGLLNRGGERHGDVEKPGRQREEVRQRAGAAQPFFLRVCLSASVLCSQVFPRAGLRQRSRGL